MPIYRYRCRACGDELDAYQSIHEEPLRRCGRCGSQSLSKIIFPPAVHVPNPTSEARKGRGKGGGG